MRDQHILKLIRNGKHSKALDQLYKNYPAVRTLITSKGGNEEDARDVFQEALIIFCEKAIDPNFTLTAATSTYLYSVSRFVWSDRLKKKKKEVLQFDTSFSATEITDMEYHIEMETKYREMDHILEKIGQKCKEILQSFYFKKKDMKTIAAEMGYNSDKIAKNQKYKCLEKAKKMALIPMTES